MKIEKWIENIIHGTSGFETMEEYEGMIHHVSREVSIASFVIRCLANTECEGSAGVLSEIMEQRHNENIST